jgi:hypothetical protein
MDAERMDGEPMSARTCGIKEHEDDCLCDVIVHATTDIKVTDGVHGMWMGAELCNARGYDYPWTTDKMLDYFTDLCTFYDRWSSLQENKYNHQNPAHERMVQLLKEGYENKHIRRMVHDEFGVDYTRSAISHTKRRIGLTKTLSK